MSEENVGLVRRGFEHFASTGDVLGEILAPEFVWDMSHFAGWPEQQTYDGIEGSRAFLRDWSEAWDDWRLEATAFHDAGDHVVAVLEQHGRAKATGLPLAMTFAMVFTVRDGLQSRMEMYSDVGEAMRVTGLPG